MQELTLLKASTYSQSDASRMAALIRGHKSNKLWEVCIGLEIHAQILSKSKLTSSSMSPSYAPSPAPPNKYVSFFDAALPGTLPTINRTCVFQAIRTALALEANVHNRCLFERKHYFYCDLPLGYQITQQRAPIATNGIVSFSYPETLSQNEMPIDEEDVKTRSNRHESTRQAQKKQVPHRKHADSDKVYDMTSRCKQIPGNVFPKLTHREVRVARIQIEQDSGKSIHDLYEDCTLVDLNRAGTGLMEIVLEPDLRSPVEIVYLVRHVQQLLRHIGTCDGNMEDGSLRCDLNVSVRPHEPESDSVSSCGSAVAHAYGQRTEIKNMNSMRNMVRAAKFEAERQIAWLEETGTPISRESRSFDAITGKTSRMRAKEGGKDYRFLPEPDLLPVYVCNEQIQKIAKAMPELPHLLQKRLMHDYGLSEYESSVLVAEQGAAAYFESIVTLKSRSPKLAAAWILNELFAYLKTTSLNILESPVSAAQLGELIDLIQDGTISGKIAKQVIEILYYEQMTVKNAKQIRPLDIIEAKRWKMVKDDDAIREFCVEVIQDPKHQKKLEAFNTGKDRLFGYFMGELMKKSQGLVHPEKGNEIMRTVLMNTKE